jgi:hypothetical protein
MELYTVSVRPILNFLRLTIVSKDLYALRFTGSPFRMLTLCCLCRRLLVAAPMLQRVTAAARAGQLVEGISECLDERIDSVAAHGAIETVDERACVVCDGALHRPRRPAGIDACQLLEEIDLPLQHLLWLDVHRRVFSPAEMVREKGVVGSSREDEDGDAS